MEDKEAMVDPYAMLEISESSVAPMSPIDLRCVLLLEKQTEPVSGLIYYDLNKLPEHIQKRYWADNAPCNVPSFDPAIQSVWRWDFRRWRNSVYHDCFKLLGITQDERKHRMDAVAYARTSLALEGAEFSREAMVDQWLFIAGLISASDVAESAKNRLWPTQVSAGVNNETIQSS